MSNAANNSAARLLAVAALLVWPGKFLAQAPPFANAVIIGASESDDIRLPKIAAADSSSGELANALAGAGMASRSILLRRRTDAKTAAVRRALTDVLKDRASGGGSVLVFLAGVGRVDVVGGARRAFLITNDTYSGAKGSTAFGLGELGQLLAESKAAAIYLVVDLAGDSVAPELDVLAKSPRVVFSAISSDSAPDLPLAVATARTFTSATSPNLLTAGALKDSLSLVRQARVSIQPQQLSAALFASRRPDLPVTPAPGAEPKPPPSGAPAVPTEDRTKENARALIQKGDCRGAFGLLVNSTDPAIADLRRQADACVSKADALSHYVALSPAASVGELHSVLGEVQSALEKNPRDADLSMAAAELPLREQYARADGLLQADPDAALHGFQQFLKTAQTAPPPVRRRLQALVAEAQKKSKIAEVESTLKQGQQLYSLRNRDGAREVLFKIRDDPRAQAILNQISDQNLQGALDDALRKGKAALGQQDWDTAIAEYSSAKALTRGQSKEAEIGLQEANAGRAKRTAEATAQRATKLTNLLWLALGGLALAVVTLIMAFFPKRRADVLFKLGFSARAARLYSKSGDNDQALRICRSHAAVNPDDDEIRRVAADIHFASRDEAGAAEAYFDLMRRGYGDESMYARVTELIGRLSSLAVGTDRSSVASLVRGVLDNHPGSPSLKAALAMLYGSDERTDAEALEVYAAAAAQGGGSRDLLRPLARGEFQRGRYPDAFRWARKALAADVRDAEIVGVLIGSSQQLGSLQETLEFLNSLHLDAVGSLMAFEAIGAGAPQLRDRIQELYREKLREVNGNERERALIEAHIALGENRFRDAQNLLKSVVVEGDFRSIRSVLVAAYRRILERDREAPSDLTLELARLYGAAGDVTAAARLLSSAIHVRETQKAAMSLLEEIYDAVPIRQLAARLFEAAGWTVAETLAGLTASEPARDGHPGLENCLVATFNDPIRVAEADDVRSLISTDGGTLNHRFAFMLVPIRPRHEVYAFLYSLPSGERAVWIVPLDAPSVRKALVREDARGYIDHELDLWRGRIDLYMDRDAITDPVRFFGRERYFNELTRRIASHENFGIFGIRKIGKTSLAVQLRWNLQHELVGFADTQRFSSSRVEEAYFLLIGSLLDDARRKFPLASLRPSRLSGYEARNEYPHVTSDFAQDVTQIQQDLQTAGHSPRILLIIDEVELLVPYGSSPGKPGYEDFFRTLRGLHQMNDHVVSAIMGADPSLFRAAVWGERDNPVFQYYEEIFLTGFEQGECDAMIEGIGRLMGIEYPPEILAIIYRESGGHPFVARQLASSLIVRHPERPLVVDAEMIETAIEDYLSVKGDYFEGIFKGNSLSRTALEVLTECAGAEQEVIGRDDLVSFAARRNITRIELDTALRDLELFGLFFRERQTYGFRTQLMRRWIRRSWLGIE